jgi:hypothetical protein
VLGAFCIGL